MSVYRHIKTPLLDIAYLEWNPAVARTAVLLHGWPDSPESWNTVAGRLAAAGYRVLCPALRGFGPTRFLRADTPRSGELAALGRDLLDFCAALDLDRPVLAGHDWGARAVGNACGLDADVASHMVLISVGYGTNSPDQPLPLSQARNYWYHWFMATPRGAATVRDSRREFTRYMWDTWSPAGWFKQADFDEAARAFDNPDWAEVVLHSYRQRWGHAEGDPAYAGDTGRLTPAPTLAVPTLVLHGGADACNPSTTSENKEAYFSGRYQRRVLDGVGHFPQREAPQAVAEAILRFCEPA